MPAPVVASVGANHEGGSSEFTVPAPAGVEAGDLLVMFLGTDTSGGKFTGPSGWTQLARMEGADTGGEFAVWQKIATGSDSYACKVESFNDWAAIAIRITGHDPAAPIPVSGKAFSSSNVASLKSAVIVTPRDDCLVISMFGDDSAATGIGWSSAGATEFFDFQDSEAFIEIAGYSETKTPKGEISRTASLTPSNKCSSIIFAVQPPEAEAPVGPRPGSRSLMGVGR